MVLYVPPKIYSSPPVQDFYYNLTCILRILLFLQVILRFGLLLIYIYIVHAASGYVHNTK